MNTDEKRLIEELYFSVAEPTIYSLANEQGWDDVERFGHGGLVEEPIEVKGWQVMPPGYFNGNIPQEAVIRAKIVKESLPIKGFLIADDKRHRRYKDPKDRDKAILVGAVIAGITWTVVAGALIISAATSAIPAPAPAPVVTAGALGSAPLIVPLVAAAVVLDPILLCVTMEDEWVALYRWED